LVQIAEALNLEDRSLTVGQQATLACLLEVAAAKPGNVHRAADFEDLVFEDFLVSATLLGNVLDAYRDHSVGKTIEAAISQTQNLVRTNTNLGLVLLIVPLAKAAQHEGDIRSQTVQLILDQLTNDDAEEVYRAIRISGAGGLGTVEKHDVRGPSGPDDLIAAMQMAEARDLVAAQYSSGFTTVLEVVVPLLSRGRNECERLSEGIVFAHVALMSRFPDSLIQRKCGWGTACTSQMLAKKAMDAWESKSEAESGVFWERVAELDFWLRCDGHRRNPGTTADLIAAGLFVAIHNGTISAPFR
jgi:triphosphoribosyl-dephospho-CoA synthase